MPSNLLSMRFMILFVFISLAACMPMLGKNDNKPSSGTKSVISNTTLVVLPSFDLNKIPTNNFYNIKTDEDGKKIIVKKLIIPIATLLDIELLWTYYNKLIIEPKQKYKDSIVCPNLPIFYNEDQLLDVEYREWKPRDILTPIKDINELAIFVDFINLYNDEVDKCHDHK